MNTKRCVCVCSFCLGQESARIWSKWLAWVCAWQVSRERAGKSRGEFQEVAKAFHFGFRLKISVFWHLDLKSTLLSTFNLWPLLSRPRVDLRYPIKCEKLQQLGWRAEVSWTEGIRQTGTVTHTHTHTPFLYGVLVIHALLVFTVKWYRDNPDFWSDISEDQPPIRREFENAATTVVPISSESWLTGRDLIFFPYK